VRDRLQTDRLVLRTLKLSDAERYANLVSDWDIAKMTGSLPYPMPVLSAEIKIEMLLSRRRRGLAFPYAITKDGKDLLGVMDIFKSTEARDFELGYWVARECWGKGYAVESAKAVMTEAQTSLGANKFVAGVFADNPASMSVLHKLGFRKVGSDGDYFSMARLKHMESIGFERIVTSQPSNCLQTQGSVLIEAS